MKIPPRLKRLKLRAAAPTALLKMQPSPKQQTPQRWRRIALFCFSTVVNSMQPAAMVSAGYLREVSLWEYGLCRAVL